MRLVSPDRPMDISASKYRNQLREHLEYEAEIQREENRGKIRSESHSSLKRSNLGYVTFAEPLKFQRVRLPVTITAEKTDDIDIREDYGLFEGHEVLVQTGHYNQKPRSEESEPIIHDGFEGIISKLREDTIYVDFPTLAQSTEQYEQVVRATARADFVHIGEILNPTVFKREDNAVRSLDSELLELVSGHRNAAFDPDEEALQESKRFDKELYQNDQQAEGIKHALTAQDIACIQGPPGTGKTRVIIELVQRLVNAGKKVLVSAETHQAVSNILVGDSEIGNPDSESLHYYERVNGITVNRVNPRPDKIGPFEKRHYSSEKSGGQVYITTNNSAATITAAGSKKFDVAIIDEATQARQPSSYIPMSISETAILVGDHKQLGPGRPYTPDTDLEPPKTGFDAEKSLFALLYDDDDGVFGADLGVMFDTQYRMHPDIAGFPSHEFYEGKLQTKGETGRLKNLQPVLGFHVQNRDPDDKEVNYPEAKAVVEYVKKLINLTDIPPGEIGIGAAYRDQATKIGSLLQQTEVNYKPILVETFDSFQGSERSVMVLSFTRSNSHGNIGYLSDETGKRRLNVALSRAKHHCALFADWDTFTTGSDLYVRLEEYIQDVGKVNDR